LSCCGDNWDICEGVIVCTWFGDKLLNKVDPVVVLIGKNNWFGDNDAICWGVKAAIWVGDNAEIKLLFTIGKFNSGIANGLIAFTWAGVKLLILFSNIIACINGNAAICWGVNDKIWDKFNKLDGLTILPIIGVTVPVAL